MAKVQTKKATNIVKWCLRMVFLRVNLNTIPFNRIICLFCLDFGHWKKVAYRTNGQLKLPQGVNPLDYPLGIGGGLIRQQMINDKSTFKCLLDGYKMCF